MATGMEALIALASLGLAIPGVIDVLFRAGQYLEDLAKKYKGADATVERFELIGQSMARGQLRSQVTIITMYTKNAKVDNAIVDNLDTCFRQLVKDIMKAHKLLLRVRPPPDKSLNLGVLRKLKVTFRDEIKMKSCLDRISASEVVFVNTSLLCFQIASGPDVELLTTNEFVVPQETKTNTPGTKLPHSPMLITSGNYKCKDGSQKKSDVILEQRPILPGGIEDAGVLVRKLQSKPCIEGILPCLGYRQNPHNHQEFELIFELPTPSERESLWQFLRRPDRPTSLSVRKSLCEQLAQAISFVHGIGMVHKNIRPANILLVKSDASAIATTLFLGDWTLVRSFRTLTAHTVGKNQWAEKLYLHPVRQKQIIEERYTILHDIFSLGVCMLELLLGGDPLVLGDDDEASFDLCPLLRDAFVASDLPPGVAHDATPDTFFADPQHVKTVLVKLATEELPRRVGDKLATLTVRCLEGFDGMFGEADSIGQDNVTPEQIAREIADGVNFISLVQLELNSISV
jgi:serine/threonine protein kinase